MSPRLLTGAAALAAALAVCAPAVAADAPPAAGPTPAAAPAAGTGPAAGSGTDVTNTTTLTLSGPGYRALRAARVSIRAVAPATGAKTITLPVSGLTPLGTDSAVLAHRGGLRVSAGRRSVTLATPSLTVGPNADITAVVAGKRPLLFKVDGSHRQIDGGTGSIKVPAAAVTLTKEGARVLRQRLRRPGIAPGRVGTLTVSANPTVTGMPGFASLDGPPMPGGASLAERPASAVSVTGGTVTWAVRRSWLGYLEQGGGATGEDGAQFDQEADHFSLPISGGWYDRASGRGVITTTGTTKFQFLGHQIDIALADWAYDLTGERPKAVTTVKTALHSVILPGPKIIGTRQPLLNVKSTAPPVPSADGTGVTWTDVPLTLSNEGIGMFLVYPYDSDQGKLSIAATLG